MAEDVKANPAIVPATLTVLGYPQERRPFLAVHSGDIMQVQAWLALLDRPRDIDVQMELYQVRVCSLACTQHIQRAVSRACSPAVLCILDSTRLSLWPVRRGCAISRSC